MNEIEVIRPESYVTFRFMNQFDVRATVRNGTPWFVARDVCDYLEFVNIPQALQRLDDDERESFFGNLPGRLSENDSRVKYGEVNLVNESGLYHLIFRSDKPKAKDFRRWITYEVLPAIRKTGSYSLPSVNKIPSIEQDLDSINLPKPLIEQFENFVRLELISGRTKKAAHRLTTERLSPVYGCDIDGVRGNGPILIEKMLNDPIVGRFVQEQCYLSHLASVSTIRFREHFIAWRINNGFRGFKTNGLEWRMKEFGFVKQPRGYWNTPMYFQIGLLRDRDRKKEVRTLPVFSSDETDVDLSMIEHRNGNDPFLEYHGNNGGKAKRWSPPKKSQKQKQKSYKKDWNK
jgi:prophage antirepressor-like protein